MIFEVSKAIERKHRAMADVDVSIVDLSDVPMLGVTASLAIENAIQDACEKGLKVFVVGAAGKVKRRLENLGLFSLIPQHHLVMERTAALQQAVALVEEHTANPNTNETLLASY